MKPIVSSHGRSRSLSRPCGGRGGWGRHSGTADLSTASSNQSRKAEATGDGVGGFRPPQLSPSRAEEGAQQRKRRYDSNFGSTVLVGDDPGRRPGNHSGPIANRALLGDILIDTRVAGGRLCQQPRSQA